MNRSGKTQRPGPPVRERGREMEAQTVRSVDLYLGAAPLLETRVVEGLVAFGKKHPGWRFSLRQAGFRYTRAWLKRNRTDGVLLAVGGESQEPVLRREGIPYVRLLQPDLRRPEDVMVDDVAIGACGADFFLRQGFRRCVFCGVGTNWSDRRRQGFERRLAGAGVSCAVYSFPFSDVAHWQFGPAADGRLRRLVRSLPTGTAILAAHDALAKRIIDASLREGRRIPQEIAVLGVGNHALLCLVSPVPISSVETRVPVATFRAAERLEALFAGREIRQPELVTPYGVVARASTETRLYGEGIVATVCREIEAAVGRGETDLTAALSRHAMSRRTLDRRFQRYAGRTVAAEIREARLRRARELMEAGTIPLTQIAAACGFADLSHMGRLFRRRYGQSPRDFLNTR